MWDVAGVIVQGYGVASGKGGDLRFPEGTLSLQWPIFNAHGLNLDAFFMGTINVSIKPYAFSSLEPLRMFPNIKWCDEFPAEDFSFFDARLCVRGNWHTGLIYYPHPDTKPDHQQDRSTVEVLMPWIDDLSYGQEVRLAGDADQSTLVER